MFRMIHNFNKDYTKGLIESGIVTLLTILKLLSIVLHPKKIVLMK